ncbi:uncharacterized protein MONBRDRAFT_11753 [Monosiga brevicollis MX1]|uniref:MYND-type domain-containing protein n=1 Tax=Monosiga brevicollis TaxID=81824 RepID=A9VA69_MONBE|nr:uncharacterized protein MONBRDRAFT_11753 [Monosiga brevicollis MX1]EDQ85613.1 predicted protein [Monosiga brevicollis MX1]|eukprot:XP_001749562.1 hypothetical protein [Monosiga brevicollis MX1]
MVVVEVKAVPGKGQGLVVVGGRLGAGTAIRQALPVVAVVEDDERFRRCAGCGLSVDRALAYGHPGAQAAVEMTGDRPSWKRCSRCKNIAYCSPGCQKRDWKAHKRECASFNKLMPNTFGWCDTFDMSSFGAVVYAELSRANHSCQPNAAVVYNGAAAVLRSMRDIPEGEEVCISYVDPTLARDVRRRELVQSYGFACDCARCATEASQDPDAGVKDVAAWKQAQADIDAELSQGRVVKPLEVWATAKHLAPDSNTAKMAISRRLLDATLSLQMYREVGASDLAVHTSTCELLTLAQLQFELGQPEGPETLHHAKTMLELVFGMDHPIRAQINLGMPPL